MRSGKVRKKSMRRKSSRRGMSKKRKRVSKKSKTRRTRRSTVKKGRNKTHRRKLRGGTTKAERVLRDLQQHGKEVRAKIKEDEMDDLKRELQSLTLPQLKAWAREAGIPKGERAGKGEEALVEMIVTAEEGKANKAKKREATMMREWREGRLSGAKPSLDTKFNKQSGKEDEKKAADQ